MLATILPNLKANFFLNSESGFISLVCCSCMSQTTKTDHNRLIKNAAKSFLQPLGCKQKGTSRTWLDPHPLWVGVIEFQPSSWARGSYLNVGACWLWYEKDYLSFDDGGRVVPFSPVENEVQFAEAAIMLATRARDEVLGLRARFASMDQIAAHLMAASFSSIWQNYRAAIAAVLVNDMPHAVKRFSAIANDSTAYPWAVELKERASILNVLSSDSVRFAAAINQIVEQSRVRLKIV